MMETKQFHLTHVCTWSNPATYSASHSCFSVYGTRTFVSAAFFRAMYSFEYPRLCLKSSYAQTHVLCMSSSELATFSEMNNTPSWHSPSYIFGSNGSRPAHSTNCNV